MSNNVINKEVQSIRIYTFTVSDNHYIIALKFSKFIKAKYRINLKWSINSGIVELVENTYEDRGRVASELSLLASAFEAGYLSK